MQMLQHTCIGVRQLVFRRNRTSGAAMQS